MNQASEMIKDVKRLLDIEVDTLDLAPDLLEKLSAKLSEAKQKIAHLIELVDYNKDKRKSERLVQMLLQHGFTQQDLQRIEGKTFFRNVDGEVTEASYPDDSKIVFLKKKNEDDVPF